MSGSLERRVDRIFLEIEGRLRGRPITAVPPEVLKPTSYVDDQIDKYEFYLTEIMRNVREARATAPCSGCKKTIEGIKIVTIGSLTALAIYKAMSSDGRTRADFSDGEIQRIKKEIELMYANY